MKNSIGSLAALASFAVPALATPLPDPVSADFNHVPISLSDPTHIEFDIDGDNQNDFYVYGNSGFAIRVGILGTNKFSSPLAFDDFFYASSASFTSNTLIDENKTFYLGFSFVTGEGEFETVHAAWVLFDTNESAPMVVGGGWQPVSGDPVRVGSPVPSAIPEPASFGSLAGAVILTGALARRRRRAPSA